MDEEKMEKTGERAGKKRKGDTPQGSRVTNDNGHRRSLLRWTRAHGKRARAPEGRKGRKTGGEVRSGKNDDHDDRDQFAAVELPKCLEGPHNTYNGSTNWSRWPKCRFAAKFQKTQKSRD